MYTKQRSALVREEFWTTFGRYLKPVRSEGPVKVNWINYKTQCRFINFKMNADEHKAVIAVECAHPSDEERFKSFDQFIALKRIMEDQLRGTWVWQRDFKKNNDKVISRICSELVNVNINNKEDWPAIITFFKEGITGLDRFWVQYQDVFQMQ